MPLTAVLACTVTPPTQGAIQNALVQQRRLQPGDVGAHHAAVVGVGADFLVLFGFRNAEGSEIEMFVQQFGLPGQAFVMRRPDGADEAADGVKMTLDTFRFDKAAQVGAGFDAFAIVGLGLLPAQAGQHFCE